MSTANPFVASDDEHWFAPAPRWWSGVLGGFDRVAVAWIGRAPGARIVAIDRLGRRMHAAGLVPPTPEATRALFPDIGPTEARWITVSVRLPYQQTRGLAPGAHRISFEIRRGDVTALEKSTFVMPR